FRRSDPPEGFALALAGDDDKASIRLRIADLGASEARAGIDAFVKAHEPEYGAGFTGAPGITSGRGRRTAAVEGKDSLRIVLVVFDGVRRYELFCEGAPGAGEELAAVAEGFTILDPKGAPEGAPLLGDAKAGTIEHAYYRLKLLKPEGFLQQEVDPESDKGIYLHLRREDDQRNRCDIRVRVFLAKSLKEGVEAKAQRRIDDFRGRNGSVKGPLRAPRSRMPGSNAAFRFEQVGRSEHGQVVDEKWLILDHENGRLYEFEVVCYGAAGRAFKKDIDAFWKGIRIQD
ncbi:MAG TPA: hypothetical protein VFY93_08775, partial [Planctomycetota bacterium]|nr:hypothetical protein [Planctomycetota bacterium]